MRFQLRHMFLLVTAIALLCAGLQVTSEFAVLLAVYLVVLVVLSVNELNPPSGPDA